MLILTELMEPSIRTFSLSLRLISIGWNNTSLLDLGSVRGGLGSVRGGLGSVRGGVRECKRWVRECERWG